MKTEIVMNGHITVLLIPENDAEKEVLRMLHKQDNEIIEQRSAVTVLAKIITNGLIITKKQSPVTPIAKDDKELEETL